MVTDVLFLYGALLCVLAIQIPFVCLVSLKAAHWKSDRLWIFTYLSCQLFASLLICYLLASLQGWQPLAFDRAAALIGGCLMFSLLRFWLRTTKPSAKVAQPVAPPAPHFYFAEFFTPQRKAQMVALDPSTPEGLYFYNLLREQIVRKPSTRDGP